MNIIFHPEQVQAIRDQGNHTILELDRIRPAPGAEPVTAYCVVSEIPLTELNLTQAYVTWHQEMLAAYRAKHWPECVRALNMLSGKFNGELDTFYNELRERIRLYMKSDPGPDWQGIFEPWANPVS